MKRSIHFGTAVLVLFGNAAPAQQPTAAERVAALKASLAASQVSSPLRVTTVVSTHSYWTTPVTGRWAANMQPNVLPLAKFYYEKAA